jgi:iron complex outermembrane recepter protein
MNRSKFLRRSVARIAATLLAGTATSAFAQEAEDAEEIIVTAQKRSESLQEVPIAITAFTSANLENKAVDDAVDLSFSVPNLTVSDAGSASLRGVGNLAISSTSESGLGYHVNGVYLGAPGAEQEYYDIERIEVLRGPQGTLYGRNTTAGVLNIITKKADDKLGGYLQGTYGNYDTIKLKGAVNLPITDGIATRLAGFYLKRDGYTRNLFDGSRIDGRDMYGLRSTTSFELGDNTKADFVFSYFREKDDRSNTTKGVCTREAGTGCSALSAGFETPDSRTTLFNTLGFLTGTLSGTTDYFANTVNPANLRIVNQNTNPTYFVREYNASLELTHDFGGVSLTSLTGYQKIRRDVLNDFDRFAPSGTLLRPITFDPLANGNRITTNQIISARRDLSNARQWYQEVRLASDFDGAFNFLVGGTYYDINTDILVSITHPTLAARQQQSRVTATVNAPNGFPAIYEAFLIESNPSNTTSYGFFGEVYFDLSDRNRLTGGLRYSHDKKEILTRQIAIFAPLVVNTVPTVPGFTAGSFRKGVVTGRVVLDHKFSDGLNGYFTVSRGYKAGGINPGGPAGGLTFAPEFLNAGEVGLKGQTRDGTFTANVAAFYYDYKDLQIGQVAPTSALTVNTDATVYGLEAEFAVRPVRALQFDGSLSYLNTKIKNFTSGDEGDPNGIAPGTVPVRDPSGAIIRTSGGLVLKNLDGNELPFSPNWKISVGLQYEIALGGWTLTPRIDHYQQGNFLGTAFNKPSERFDGYSQTDLKLLLKPENGKWELRAFAKNIFNNADITRITQDGPLVGRFRSLVVLEPRTYGLEATIRF